MAKMESRHEMLLQAKALLATAMELLLKVTHASEEEVKRDKKEEQPEEKKEVQNGKPPESPKPKMSPQSVTSPSLHPSPSPITDPRIPMLPQGYQQLLEMIGSDPNGQRLIDIQAWTLKNLRVSDTRTNLVLMQLNSCEFVQQVSLAGVMGYKRVLIYSPLMSQITSILVATRPKEKPSPQPAIVSVPPSRSTARPLAAVPAMVARPRPVTPCVAPAAVTRSPAAPTKKGAPAATTTSLSTRIPAGGRAGEKDWDVLLTKALANNDGRMDFEALVDHVKLYAHQYGYSLGAQSRDFVFNNLNAAVARGTTTGVCHQKGQDIIQGRSL